MKMFQVLLVLCLATVTYCQTQCQSCVESAFKSHFQQVKNEMEQKEADFKAKRDACFTNNGCKVPTFNMSHSGTVSNMNHGPFEASNDSCFRNALETCVQQNFSLFKLPSFHGFEGGFPNMGSANNFQRRDVIVDSGDVQNTCPNNTSKASLEVCLRGLFSNNDHHTDPKVFTESRKRFVIEVVSNCSKTTGQNCSVELQGIKEAFCNCTKSKETFAKCVNHTESAGGQQFGRGVHPNFEGAKPFGHDDSYKIMSCGERGPHHFFGHRDQQ